MIDTFLNIVKEIMNVKVQLTFHKFIQFTDSLICLTSDAVSKTLT